MSLLMQPSSRSFLLIVSVKLIKQWKRKLWRIVSFIQIYKYYDDYWAKSTLNEVIINKSLIKDHSLFCEDSVNTKAVVLTLYDTMQRRHDSHSQYDWWLKYDKWKKIETKKNYKSYNEWWSEDLTECFDKVVLRKCIYC